MFSVSQVLANVKADLDAEGSDRYLWDQDFKPAINRAILWTTMVVNHLFSTSRIAGENLKDLKKVRVWVSSSFSRVKIDPDDLGHQVWTIVQVIPNPEVFPKYIVGAESEKPRSKLTDVVFVKGTQVASRSTEAEYEEMHNNIFANGNDVVAGNESLKTYAYIDHTTYAAGTKYTMEGEIEISPDHKNKLVAIRYIKFPDSVEAEEDNIEFPENLLQFFSEKVANFIAKKQGDETTLMSVTDKDIEILLQLIG